MRLAAQVSQLAVRAEARAHCGGPGRLVAAPDVHLRGGTGWWRRWCYRSRLRSGSGGWLRSGPLFGSRSYGRLGHRAIFRSRPGCGLGYGSGSCRHRLCLRALELRLGRSVFGKPVLGNLGTSRRERAVLRLLLWCLYRRRPVLGNARAAPHNAGAAPIAAAMAVGQVCFPSTARLSGARFSGCGFGMARLPGGWF